MTIFLCDSSTSETISPIDNDRWSEWLRGTCFDSRYHFTFISTQVNMSQVPEQATKATGDWSQLLRDKVVFVTGAGGAIGSAIAETCAVHGARVAVADVNRAAADQTVAKIVSEHADKKDDVISIELDVTDEVAIQSAVQRVVEKWKTIDVLVNKYVKDFKMLINRSCFPLLLVPRYSHLVQSKMSQQKHGRKC